MDLSKYLKATDPAAPNIELVVRSAPIEEYLTLLKDAGLGPTGQAMLKSSAFLGLRRLAPLLRRRR